MGPRRRSSGGDVPVVALLVWVVLAIQVSMSFQEEDQEDIEDSGYFDEKPSQRKDGMWLKKDDFKNPNVLAVQALIVKDEKVTDSCQPPTMDLRKANWRYVMCFGSILTNTFILTSTSCLHEALYIRHNVRATLAAVVGPVSESIQVIKIAHYLIHPELDVDPRHTEDHIKHDLAIAKLACKISKANFHPIALPTKPLSDMCADDNCHVALIKKSADHSGVIVEYLARDIETNKETNKKRLMCTKTGAAVMSDKAQAGVVSMSCDVRQPHKPWLYTDIFDNIEWIVSVADLEMPKDLKEDDKQGKSSGKCSTCIYNFFFEAKVKDICPNKIINDLNSPTCKSQDSSDKKSKSRKFDAYPKDEYMKAINIMYRDQFKHNHKGVPIVPSSQTLSLDEKMIPVTDDFNYNNATDLNNNNQTQNDTCTSEEKRNDTSISNQRENSNQKLDTAVFENSGRRSGLALLKNKKSKEIAARTQSDVPNEYSNLYRQYLREFQLKNN